MKHILLSLFILVLAISNLSAQAWQSLVQEGKSLGEIDAFMENYIATLDSAEAAQEYKFYGRWRLEAYYASYGEIDPQEKFKKDWKSIKAMQSSETLNRNNFGTWENITPDSMFTASGTPFFGVIQDIYFDENNDEILYAGTHGNGLLRKIAGGHWEELTSSLPIQGVGGVVAKGNVIVVLSGAKAASDFRSTGIFVSYDFGQTWDLKNIFGMSLPIHNGTFDLVADPNNFSRQYALTRSGIYYTDDNWTTWSQKTFSATFNLIFDPENIDQIFYSTKTQLFKSNLEIDSFEVIFQDPFASKILVCKSEAAPIHPLYFASLSGWPFKTAHFFRSFDDGDTYIAGDTNTTDFSQLGWNWMLTAHPTQFDRVFFGATGLYESTDWGNSWSHVGGDGSHADQHCFQWVGTTLYLGSDGGICHSSSQEEDSWDASLSAGMKNILVPDIDALGNKFIGGFYHSGTQNWSIGDQATDIVIGGDGFECFYDPDIPSDFYVTDQNSGFYKNGSGSRIKANDESYWGQPFFPDPLYSDYFFYANKRVYLYEKNSQTFTDLNLIEDTLRVTALAVCKSNSNRGYATFGEDPGEKYFIDFTYANEPIDRSDSLPTVITIGRDVSNLIVDENDPDKVWMAVRRYNEQNLFYSEDRGNSWEDISGDLPAAPIFCIQRVQSNNQIYVGTEYGIYYKNDDMDDWIRFSNGLGYHKVIDMAIDGGYIYASVGGSGIWRTPLRSTCPINRYVIESIYGDPFYPGYLRLEASNNLVSDIYIRANIGTDVILSGGNGVTLGEGFRARSTSDTMNILGIEPSKIVISSEGCSQ